jgi:hypothetical protein
LKEGCVQTQRRQNSKVDSETELLANWHLWCLIRLLIMYC